MSHADPETFVVFVRSAPERLVFAFESLKNSKNLIRSWESNKNSPLAVPVVDEKYLFIRTST
jgi:hypothetical protein